MFHFIPFHPNPTPRSRVSPSLTRGVSRLTPSSHLTTCGWPSSSVLSSFASHIIIYIFFSLTFIHLHIHIPRRPCTCMPETIASRHTATSLLITQAIYIIHTTARLCLQYSVSLRVVFFLLPPLPPVINASSSTQRGNILVVVVAVMGVYGGYDQVNYLRCLVWVILAASAKIPWLARPVLLTASLFSEYAWFVVFQGLLESG